MEYKNAAKILPDKLLKEIQTYIDGEMLYIPKSGSKIQWGMANGTRSYYQERNQRIKELYGRGYTMGELAEWFGLSAKTVKNIVYQ